MGINEEIRQAFAECGQVLAEMTGMASDAAGNTQILNQKYLGVFGPARVDRQPMLGGGYRERTVVPWVGVRSQFTAPPKANSELVRIDLDEPITYRIADVLTHDPVHYVFNLVHL